MWCAFFSHGLDVSRAESAVDLTCSGARHARVAKSRWLRQAAENDLLEQANLPDKVLHKVSSLFSSSASPVSDGGGGRSEPRSDFGLFAAVFFGRAHQ